MSVTALALGSAGFFGFALVLTEIGLRTVKPLAGACISVPTTALLWIVLAPWTLDLDGWHGQSALLFALAGCLFPAAVTLLTFEANRRVGANVTGALGNLTPAIALLGAVLLLGEAPRAGQLAGLAVILAGVLLIAGTPRLAGTAAAWGLALPLVAALIRGLVQPVVKLGFEAWPSPFAAALIGYIMSATVILSAGTLSQGRALRPFAYQGWKLFPAIGLCNGLALLLMYTALSRGQVALVAPLVACYPIATLVFARLLLGPNGLGVRGVAGILLTVTGVGVLLLG